MRKEGFSAVFLVLFLSALFLGVVVARWSKTSVNNPAVEGVSTLADLPPTSNPAEEASPAGDQATVSGQTGLEPINVETEMKQEEVLKIQMRETSGVLDVSLEEATDGGTLRKRGQTDRVVLFLGGTGPVEIRARQSGLELTSGGTRSVTDFPLTFNKTTNQLMVDDQTKLRFIRIFPNQALEIAKTVMNGEMKNMELAGATKGDVGDDLVYKITAIKTGKMFGLFPLTVTSETMVGAQSGLVVNVNEPFLLKFLSGLII